MAPPTASDHDPMPVPHSGRENSPMRVVEMVTNLDDLSPQVIGHAQQALLDAGALDVWTTPIGMKKQRPGVMLSVLCEEHRRSAIAELALRLTGSMGLRYKTWDRMVLERRFEQVQTPWGPMRIKLGLLDGRCLVARPEYDSALELARRAGVPLREVLEAGQAAAQRFRLQAAEPETDPPIPTPGRTDPGDATRARPDLPIEP